MIRIKSLWANLTHDSNRSVGFPLYRLIALFVLPPAILQLVFWEVPAAIGSTTPGWYDAVFIVIQLIGAVMVMMSLAIGDTPDSARLERIAVVILGGTGFIYFGVAWAYDGWQPPLATATWMQLAFSIFCVIRWVQINNRLNRMMDKVKLDVADGYVRDVD